MNTVSSYMGFNCGETVYFCLKSVPCTQGEIRKILPQDNGGAIFHIRWNGMNAMAVVPYEQTFKDKDLCEAFWSTIQT